MLGNANPAAALGAPAGVEAGDGRLEVRRAGGCKGVRKEGE